MALFSFKTRSPDRDSDTDQARFGSLSKTMAELIGQMEAEASGLKARYQRVADNAAFSLLAVENGAGSHLSTNVTDLTQSMARSKQRLADLHGDVEFVRGLQASIDGYLPRG